MSRIFIDTNILVYCMDNSEPDRKITCRKAVQHLTVDLQGVISTQVMQEFYVAATKKLGANELVVKDILRSFEHFETVIITPDMI